MRNIWSPCFVVPKYHITVVFKKNYQVWHDIRKVFRLREQIRPITCKTKMYFSSCSPLYISSSCQCSLMNSPSSEKMFIFSNILTANPPKLCTLLFWNIDLVYFSSSKKDHCLVDYMTEGANWKTVCLARAALLWLDYFKILSKYS